MAGSPVAGAGRCRRDRRGRWRLERRHRVRRSGLPGSLRPGRSRRGGRAGHVGPAAWPRGRLRRSAGRRRSRLLRVDRLVADAAGLLWRRRPLARRGRGRSRRCAARGPPAPPARGRRVGALRGLAAADRLRHPAAGARGVLPDLAAAAGRARLSQRDRRLRGAGGARRAVARERPAARPPRRRLRHAGAARARPGARLLARRHAGGADRLRGLAGRLRAAHRERRGAARRARGERSGGPLGTRPALLQGARRALHRPRRLAPRVVLRRRRAGGRRPRPARGRARAVRRAARCAGAAATPCWPP